MYKRIQEQVQTMKTLKSQPVTEPETGVFPSVEACAVFLGVSARHLRTEIKANRFPHLRMGYRIILSRRAVLAFLAGCGKSAKFGKEKLAA